MTTHGKITKFIARIKIDNNLEEVFTFEAGRHREDWWLKRRACEVLFSNKLIDSYPSDVTEITMVD